MKIARKLDRKYRKSLLGVRGHLLLYFVPERGIKETNIWSIVQKNCWTRKKKGESNCKV